jgi:adenine-specific DNA methylase
VLEPAVGLGHFIGLMPDDLQARSRITGIEIDSVTARSAKLLYPDADIRRKPFEESVLPDGGFDVAVGSVPFGDYKPFDPRFKGWNFLIHDYFFAATLNNVRPGGFILFITSKGTLDKQPQQRTGRQLRVRRFRWQSGISVTKIHQTGVHSG